MSFNIAMVIASTIYLFLIVSFFFFKPKVTNTETKIYSYLLISDIFLVFFELLCILSAKFDSKGETMYAHITGRGFLVAILLWILIFTFYVIIITLNDKTKSKMMQNFKFYKGLLLFILSISICLVLFLPLYFYSDNKVAYTYGASTNFLLFIIAAATFINIFCAIKNRKHLEKKKIVPIFVFLASIMVLVIVRSNLPQIQVTSAIFTFVSVLMYFTIENPDVKMIEELVKVQKLSEKTNTDKSNFIYTVTEDIQNRLDNAEKVYNNVIELNPNEEIKEEMNNLRNIITGARNMLNSAMGVSHDDNKHLQLTNNKYSIKLLLDSVYSLKKNEIKNNIDFRLNVTDDLPQELYGDSIKIKQILLSILDNSVKYTHEGFIELRVNSIIKNNICRLIISIEDSGQGIDIYKQNEIMSNIEDLTKEDIANLENKTLNLKTIRKMIAMIGGTFTIDNNKYNGTTINISLDQKIVEDIQSKEEKKIAKYSEVINNQKTCAIISNNKDNIKKIKTNIRKKGYKIFEFDVTKNALDNIRNNSNYDLIFIEENMEKIDARSFLNKVKEVEGFTGEVIIISQIKNIKIKKELIDLGFANVIYSPIDKKELEDKLNNI